MVVRRNDTSRTKHLSNNRMPSETYLEDEEGAKLLVLTDWLKNNVGALFVQIKKLETTVECIENYVEEKTGVEPGKEISSDSDSSDSDYEYEPCEAPTSSEKNICKVKLTFAVPKVQVMESKRQAERVPEGSSKKEESETRSSPKGASYASSSNNLPSDQEELTKVFEKNLEALENMAVRLMLVRRNDHQLGRIAEPPSANWYDENMWITRQV
ncbi:18603_t:CDS:2 [Rhizophagus irregularis]|nr:18603_t:CDS:2 [Rhizophagus irregularis]